MKSGGQTYRDADRGIGPDIVEEDAKWNIANGEKKLAWSQNEGEKWKKKLERFLLIF